MKHYLVPHPPLIVPGVGKGSEIPNTRLAYEKIAADVEKQNPETIIIITPHNIAYGDYFHISPGKHASGDFGKFGGKHIKISVNYDQEFAHLIGNLAVDKNLPAGTLGERDASLDHGVTVPLHFIKHKQIVRVSLSGLSYLEHYKLGMCIAEAGNILNRNFVVIASGDMSHKLKDDGPYGYDPEGPKFDNYVCECIEKSQWQKLIQTDTDFAESAAECGLKSLIMLLGVIDGKNIKGELLGYEGPYGVGYLSASFEPCSETASLYNELLKEQKEKISNIRASEDEYVRLARTTVEHFTRTGKILETPSNISEVLLTATAGVFVSIKKDGNLRGCIGTISPTEKNIAEEIIRNAISACSRDNRFPPVDSDELEHLVYSVDVLSPPESIESKNELDVNRYGVIVQSGWKRGLLLPALAGVNTVEEQIKIALQKGGIKESETYTLERFEVIRHK